MNKVMLLLLLPIFLSSCGTNKIIYVADTLADCEGVTSQKCFQIKEAMEEDWTLFYDDIEGFNYEVGFAYKIEVKITQIKNPPADGASIKYKLVNIIYQEKTESVQQDLGLKGKWKVSKLIGIDSIPKSPTLVIDLDTKKISGNAGCNNYGVSFKIDENQIKFETPFATKMYCTNMQIEKAFFDCLQKTSSYQIENGKLKLFSSENEKLLECNSITN